MLKLEMFTIHDSKAQAYLSPFFLPTQDIAIRTFTDCLNDPKHTFAKHPGDFTLFYIGQFYVTSARLESFAPVSLGNGVDLQTQQVLPFTDEDPLLHPEDRESYDKIVDLK